MPEISRRQFAVYLVAVVLVVLLGGRALRAGPAPAPDAAAFTPSAAAGTGADGLADGGTGATGAGGIEVADAGSGVLVHVAGRVRRPGVYALPAGARIADALKRAGGGRGGADLDAVNLAAKLTDGQQVLIARRGRPATVSSSGTTAPASSAVDPASGPAGAAATVNVNQADAAQLEALTGVGPAIAAKIVEYRTQNGPFGTVEDLAQVSGIGPKTLEGMRAQVAL